MRKLAWAWMVGISLSAAPTLPAQDPPEKERIVCDVHDPKSKCPGVNCLCVDDTFEITFDGGTDSVFEFETFVADTPIPTQVICDARSTKPNPAPPPDVLGVVQGWAFGVDHDNAFLTLTDVTLVGTETEKFADKAFVVVDMADIQSCANDPDPRCPNPEPAAGYIHAVVPQFLGNLHVLEPRRNVIVKADYTLKWNPGVEGTLIQVVDYLKKKNSPPVDINITVDGKSRIVTKVVDGWVKASLIEPFLPEDLATPGSCTDGADNDFDGKTDAADEGCLAECRDYAFYFGPGATSNPHAVGAEGGYVIAMRNKDAAVGFQLGVKATTAGETTTWEFSEALGPDALRDFKILIIDEKGDSKTAEAGNKASSSEATVESIVRGAAIFGFSNDDFLGFDLSPRVGLSGFTVGYVADLMHAVGRGNKISATGTGTPCPVNEMLEVNLGGAPARFRRGDANGDSKINVTDVVLIIQHLFGKIPEQLACDDVLDANDDGSLNVTDALPVLAYVFQKGPGIPEPFRNCGADETIDALACGEASCQ